MEAHALLEMTELADDDSHTWMAILLIVICAAGVLTLATITLWSVP